MNSITLNIDDRTLLILNNEAQQSDMDLAPYCELALRQKAIAIMGLQPTTLDDPFGKGDNEQMGHA